MLAVVTGPLGPANPTTGNDLPAWANVDAWSVTRWREALGERADLIPGAYRADPNDYHAQIDVPGFGSMYVQNIAALVQRTTEDPDAGRSGWWVRLFGWLDPEPQRRDRLAWRVRCAFRDEVIRIVNRRAALRRDLGLEESRDPFAPVPAPTPPIPPVRPQHP